MPPLLDTHRQVWLSLLWGHCTFLLAPSAHRFGLFPPRICFPSPVEVLWSNPTGLQSQIPWGFSVPLLDPQVGNSVVNPRTFLTVQEFLWWTCSAVFGSSVWWLYGAANGDLLQQGLCNMLRDPGLLQSEPLSPQQATAAGASTGDTQTLKDRSGSVSVVLMCTRFCLSPLSVSGGYGVWF